MADNLVYTSVARGAGIVGVFITICGLGSFVTGTVYLAKDHPQNRDSFYRGGGMWSGILLVIVGSLGIALWVKKRKDVLKVFMIAAILVTLAIIAEFFVALLAILFYNRNLDVCKVTLDSCKCSDLFRPEIGERCPQYIVTNRILLAVVVWTLAGSFLSLMASIIGCVGSCQCCPDQSTATAMDQPVVMADTKPTI